MRNNQHLIEHGPRNLAQLAQSHSPHAQGATYHTDSNAWYDQSASREAYPTFPAFDYPIADPYSSGYDALQFPASSSAHPQCEVCNYETAQAYHEDACVDTAAESEPESADASNDWNREFAGLVKTRVHKSCGRERSV